MPHVISKDRLDPRRAGLLVVDLQLKLVPAVPDAHQVVKQVLRLVETAGALQVPCVATVQYPRGLGSLIPPLDHLLDQPEAKMDFSAAVCRRGLDTWSQAGRDQVLVAGIETHICVLQTVLDLIAEGFKVFVIADAVAARGEMDHELAIARMRSAGATLTTAESVLFELLGTAEHQQFKRISKLVKDGV